MAPPTATSPRTLAAQLDLEAGTARALPRAVSAPASGPAAPLASARPRGLLNALSVAGVLGLGLALLIALYVVMPRGRNDSASLLALLAPMAGQSANVAVPREATASELAETEATTGAAAGSLLLTTETASSTTAAPLAVNLTSTPEPPTSEMPGIMAAAVLLSSGAGSTNFAVENICYNFYSEMNVNALQEYPENPDSKAFGFTTCKLCTGGAMRCTSLVHSGKSRLIAAHIHLADGDNADAGKTAEGLPVINFCGDNQTGLSADGTPYEQACSQWDSNGVAHSADMQGSLVKNFNGGTTLAQRVEDMVANPGKYYFNFHTLASWNHWYPTPHGACRGELRFQGADE